MTLTAQITGLVKIINVKILVKDQLIPVAGKQSVKQHCIDRSVDVLLAGLAIHTRNATNV